MHKRAAGRAAGVSGGYTGSVATLVRRVGVRELRLHRTVTGRLRRCPTPPTEPTRGRGGRVGRRAGTILRCGYLLPVPYPSWGAAGPVGNVPGGCQRSRLCPLVLSHKTQRSGGRNLNVKTQCGRGVKENNGYYSRLLRSRVRLNPTKLPESPRPPHAKRVFTRRSGRPP